MPGRSGQVEWAADQTKRKEKNSRRATKEKYTFYDIKTYTLFYQHRFEKNIFAFYWIF